MRRIIALLLSALLAATSLTVLGSSPASADAAPLAVANAIAGPGLTITGASYITQADSATVDVRSDAVSGFPIDPGGSYAVMSTGIAADLTLPNTSEGSGEWLSFTQYRDAYDVTTLKIDFTVGPEVNCLLGMRFRFLTEEYPEFVGSEFNDAFLVELDGNDWSLSGNDVISPHNIAFVNGSLPVTVNNSGPLSVTEAAAAGTTFDGATEILTAGAPLTPGAHSLYLTVMDLGDGILDTSVIFDDLRAGTLDPALCLSGAIATNVAPPNKFVPLNPARIIDTRPDPGQRVGPINGPIPANTPVAVTVAGQGGVPQVGASAVVVNLTVTGTTAAGFVRVNPAGAAADSSNLNIEFPNQDLANLVTVPLSADGKIEVFSQWPTHVVLDVFGYYVRSTRSSDGRFVPLDPARILSTRDAIGVGGSTRIPDNGSIDLQVLGQGGVPPTGASAVVLNLTATDTTAAGFGTVWPSGQARPNTSNVNFVRAGQTIPNQVIVPIGANGKISLYANRAVHLIADVAGYFTDSTQPELGTGLFVPVAPGRLLNTRDGIGVPSTAKPGANATVTFQATGRNGVPGVGVTAVVGNTTATESTREGFVTDFPAGIAQPNASNLNLERPNQTIANHTTVKVGTEGKVNIFTQNGTHLIFDVSGFYTS